MPFWNASCRTFTTAGSMPFGPPMPNGEFDTMSMPTSFRVGTFGQFFVRCAPQVTSSRIWPALTAPAQPVEIRLHVDVPAEQRVQAFGLALERHLRPLDALLLGDLLHRDVQARARAGRRRS